MTPQEARDRLERIRATTTQNVKLKEITQELILLGIELFDALADHLGAPVLRAQLAEVEKSLAKVATAPCDRCGYGASSDWDKLIRERDEARARLTAALAPVTEEEMDRATSSGEEEGLFGSGPLDDDLRDVVNHVLTARRAAAGLEGK